MWVKYFIMKKNKNPTILNCVEDIFKPFVNKYGEIEISENIDPILVMFMTIFLGITSTFLLVLNDPVCPYCNCKLHRHKKVNFLLNNTVNMKKMTYKCSNCECSHVITPKWNLFIEAGCNYTKSVKEYALELGLICNISYEKMAEIIYWAHGVKISRETLYKFRKDNFEGFVAKIRKQLSEMYEEHEIDFSDVLSFDEQYVLVMGEWVYKLTALDPNTGHVFDFCIATHDEFNAEFVYNFLKPLVDKFEIKTIVTDGAKMYPAIMKKLKVQHKLCNFHKMQNLLKRMFGKLISFNRKIKKLENEIEENIVRIDEIIELRRGKSGRAPAEEQAIVDEKNHLLRINRQKRDEIRKIKEKMDSYVYTKERVSFVLKSKAMPTADNRYDDLLENIERVPEELRAFVRNIEKDYESLLMHTNSKDIPTTNNEIELYHLTTLNGRDKRKYKTIEGVLEETLLKTFRWEKRVVLNIM